MIKLWMSEGFAKITGEANPPAELNNAFAIQMAKNESESCHVTLNSDTDLSGITLRQVTPDGNGLTVETLEEYLICTETGHYPDPIVPLTGGFDVKAGVNKSILIRFVSTEDTVAGEHTYVFELINADGTVISDVTVNVKVWNFVLPMELGCATAGDIRYPHIIRHEKLDPNDKETIEAYYKNYYDLMIKYKFSPHGLPYDILDPRADEYMSNPQVTGFRVDYKVDDETLVKYYEKLKTNPVWLNKSYIYVYDEPNDVNALNILKERCERFKVLCPEIPVLVAFFRNVPYDENRDQIDFMNEYVNVFCAKSAAWKPGWLRDDLKRGYFGDRMDALKPDGNKVWWYVCWEPGYPYCNMYVNEIGLQHRELFWQQYHYNSDGFLYWALNHWGEIENTWVDMANVKSLSPHVYGDGSVMYPGYNVGIKGGVASIRMECIRDGVEDFDMLKLAEKYLGREFIEEQIAKVTPTLTEHTLNNAEFAEARKIIGDALEAAINK